MNARGRAPEDGDDTVVSARGSAAAADDDTVVSPRGGDAGAEDRAGASVDVRPAARPDVRPEVRPDVRPEARPDARPELMASNALDDTVRVSSPPVFARTKPAMSPPTKRSRGQLRPAPVPAGYGGRAVRASGAGAISTYRARAIPAPPASPPVRVEAPRVHRITEGAPSVSRQSRRYAGIVLGAFAVSCAVSVLGLVVIVRAALGL